ncbi:MAG: hypothetical protein JSS76_04675 [Bacteroidetes bacterium]|nr:hypothetical protein [Bacteroidota bacterium]
MSVYTNKSSKKQKGTFDQKTKRKSNSRSGSSEKQNLDDDALQNTERSKCDQVFYQDVYIGPFIPPKVIASKVKASVTIIMWLLFLSSCEKTDVAEPPKPKIQDGKYYSTDSKWVYKQNQYNLQFTEAIGIYNFYNAVPKSLSFFSYLREDKYYPYMDQITSQLKGIANHEHFSEEDMAGCVLAWTHSIPREADPPGPEEYLRSPILTILDNRGDCDDHALLFSICMAYLGKKSCLVVYPGRHMASGIAIDGWTGPYFEGPSGTKYVFAEATWPDRALGEVSYPGDSFLVFEIDPVLSNDQYAKMIPKREKQLEIDGYDEMGNIYYKDGTVSIVDSISLADRSELERKSFTTSKAQ